MPNLNNQTTQHTPHTLDELLDQAFQLSAHPNRDSVDPVKSKYTSFDLSNNSQKSNYEQKLLDNQILHAKHEHTNQQRSKSLLHKFQNRCPRCSSPLRPATSISGAPSTDWLECTSPMCNTFVDTYVPMSHQISVHEDSHRIIGNFGSYGTGKTKTSEKEIEKHILITPNANILLGANVTSQYEQTLLRDFELSFPASFLENRSVQKGYLDFINGARLMLRPFDDPDKLRSNNYSLVVMLEASEIDTEAFHQLKTRLRNTAATNNDHDWRKLICESNPDSGWIRTDVLMVSDEITQHGRYADEDYQSQQDPSTLDPNISTHIASTDVNYFLPDDYIKVNSRNKPDWWIRRFLYGSFMFAEGLVYPNAIKCIVPTPLDSEGKPLTPKHYPDNKVLIAHDYGLRDEATFVYGMVDTKRNKLVIYRVDHTNDAPLSALAKLFHKGYDDVNIGQMYTTPIIDPKNNKRDYEKKDLISHYQDYGITFKPGYINVEARVMRLNDYIESGCLEIWDTCTFLITELKDYKFKPRTLDDKVTENKPIDANNHAINALEWIAMELPANPNRLSLSAYDEYGRKITEEEQKIRQKSQNSWQLSDDSHTFSDVEYDQTPLFSIEGGF